MKVFMLTLFFPFSLNAANLDQNNNCVIEAVSTMDEIDEHREYFEAEPLDPIEWGLIWMEIYYNCLQNGGSGGN